MRALWLAAGLAAALTTGGGPAVAQEIGPDLGLPDSAVLVVDPNRLFAETEFGKRMAGQLEAEGDALARENREIEAQLVDEEQSLTERRSAMSPQDFRAAADAFNAKVQRIRKEQDQKARRLADMGDVAQRRFLAVARPVLEEVMRDSGAAVLLDTRAVLLGADRVDITAEAVRRIDQSIGAGNDIDLLNTLAPLDGGDPAAGGTQGDGSMSTNGGSGALPGFPADDPADAAD